MVRTERTSDGGSREVFPERCPNGHPLKPSNVLIGGDVAIRTVLCRTCGVQLTSRHGSGDWTRQQMTPA
jgi:hypothetical protein